MGNNDIKKYAKQCIEKGHCYGCTYEYNENMCWKIMSCAIGILKEENANLTVENEVLKRDCENLERTLEEINEDRQETAEEFANLLL
jgi:hemerythrin-like domain-containing protein